MPNAVENNTDNEEPSLPKNHTSYTSQVMTSYKEEGETNENTTCLKEGCEMGMHPCSLKSYCTKNDEKVTAGSDDNRKKINSGDSMSKVKMNKVNRHDFLQFFVVILLVILRDIWLSKTNVQKENSILLKENEYLKGLKNLIGTENDFGIFCTSYLKTHFTIRKSLLISTALLVLIIFVVSIMIMRKTLKSTQQAFKALYATNTELKQETSMKVTEQQAYIIKLQTDLDSDKVINHKLKLTNSSIKSELETKVSFIELLQEEHLTESLYHERCKELLETQLKSILNDKQNQSSSKEETSENFNDYQKKNEMCFRINEQQILIFTLQEEIDYLKSINTKLKAGASLKELNSINIAKHQEEMGNKMLDKENCLNVLKKDILISDDRILSVSNNEGIHGENHNLSKDGETTPSELGEVDTNKNPKLEMSFHRRINYLIEQKRKQSSY